MADCFSWRCLLVLLGLLLLLLLGKLAWSCGSKRIQQQKLQQKDLVFQDIINQLPCSVLICTPVEGVLLYGNQRALQMFGFGGSADLDLVTCDALYVNPAMRVRVVQQLQECGKLEDFEIEMRRRDGSTFWVSMSSIAIDFVGKPAVYNVITDITPRKLIEISKHNSEQQYRLLAENMADVVWLVDAETLQYLYVSPSVEKLRGFSREDLLSRALDHILSPESASRFRALMQARLADAQQDAQASEVYVDRVEIVRDDGSKLWAEVASRLHLNEQGRWELIGVSRDVSERIRQEQEIARAQQALAQANQRLYEVNAELERLATTDRLTGLWNRLYFENVVDQEIARHQHDGLPLCLLLFDLDHFKLINDTYGHQVGDHVLKEVARRVQAAVGPNDVLMRWGGEEFLVLAPAAVLMDGIMLAERLRKAIHGTPFAVAGEVSASFGVAEYDSTESLAHWLRRADSGLYAAKSSGRNCVCAGVFDVQLEQ